MSQENVDVVKRVVLSGVDLVGLFRASDVPDPASAGIDPTPFTSDFEFEFIASRVYGSIQPRVSQGLEEFVERWRDWLEPYASYYRVQFYLEREEALEAVGLQG
jgi:hypothetical protein